VTETKGFGRSQLRSVVLWMLSWGCGRFGRHRHLGKE
jgi:hypothetical protein